MFLRPCFQCHSAVASPGMAALNRSRLPAPWRTIPFDSSWMPQLALRKRQDAVWGSKTFPRKRRRRNLSCKQQRWYCSFLLVEASSPPTTYRAAARSTADPGLIVAYRSFSASTAPRSNIPLGSPQSTDGTCHQDSI